MNMNLSDKPDRHTAEIKKDQYNNDNLNSLVLGLGLDQGLNNNPNISDNFNFCDIQDLNAEH